MLYQRSSTLFKEAQKYIPGGVNSPVRAFKAVGGDPIFVKHAKGAYLYDEDGNIVAVSLLGLISNILLLKNLRQYILPLGANIALYHFALPAKDPN